MDVETANQAMPEEQIAVPDAAVEQARAEEMNITAEMPARKKRTAQWVLAAVASVLLVAAIAMGFYAFTKMINLQGTVDEQTTRLSQQDEELKTKQSENEQLQQQKDALQQEKDTLESQKDALQKEKDTLKKEADALRSQIALKKQQQQQQQKPQTPPTAPQPKPAIVVDTPNGVTGPLVALTFDDGPGPYTARLLDILKEQKVKATFFVLGSRAKSYPALIKRIDAEGHAIGNHSYDHSKNLSRLSAAAVTADIQKSNSTVHNILGHAPTMLRTPGGAINQTVKNCAAAANMAVINWSVDTLDWKYRNVNSILNIAFGGNGIRDGSIVLVHDIHSTTVDAVPEMIKRLKAKNYQFVTVPELLTMRKNGMVPGTLYSSAYPS